ncbi:hypothetical protein Ahy_B08g094325 isoform C [Arachis hypogaea]|uniref:Uncharacterized protein n=1 Tax=Arachis hypogaea TaxID=3818 RepID=A0A444Y8I4_ARAHY|nr:hypothetical protein Ahy_B08g094325 isoform C [Arachis hypogaea]
MLAVFLLFLLALTLVGTIGIISSKVSFLFPTFGGFKIDSMLSCRINGIDGDDGTKLRRF